MVFGAILGPAALALLYAAPPGRCRTCLTPTRGWLSMCVWCKEDVRAVPAGKQALLARMTRPSGEPDRTPSRDQARPAATVERDAALRAAAAPTWEPTAQAVPAQAAPTLSSPTSAARVEAPRAPASSRPAVVPIAHAPRPTASANPVAELRGSSTRTQAAAAPRPPTPSGPLASATYIAGSTSLTPGGRYTFSIDGSRFRLMGPVEIDPTAVAMEFDVAECDASVMEGRLLLSRHHGRSDSVLAFMLVTGMTPEALAAAIIDAADAAGRP